MKQFFSSIFFLFFIVAISNAQSLDNPGQYMDAVSNAHLEMNQKYMVYMSAASHGKRARKVEKLRIAALESINNAKYKTIELPYYKGDNALRQSSIDYIQLCYNVFNDDYAKIVNMEEIAEQSFDEMQQYILLQEKTNEKLSLAGQKMSAAEKAFAAKYNVNLIATTNDFSEKMSVASKLNHYYNQVYLIFFKCNWQDNKISEAIKAKKINDVEQAKNALVKYVDEGFLGLDSLKNFNGDATVAQMCKQLLANYKKSAEKDIPKITDFFLKEENFNKLKKAIDANTNRTNEDINNFNKAVKEYNNAINVFNETNSNMVNNKNELLHNWEKTVKDFFDNNMPYYKK